MHPTSYAMLGLVAGVMLRAWGEYVHRALAVTAEGELVVEEAATVVEAERVLRRTR